MYGLFRKDLKGFLGSTENEIFFSITSFLDNILTMALVCHASSLLLSYVREARRQKPTVGRGCTLQHRELDLEAMFLWMEAVRETVS